jgi:hypothetical protein
LDDRVLQMTLLKSFNQILLLGNISEDILGVPRGSVVKIPLPKHLLDSSGRLTVPDLISLGEKARRGAGFVLLLTDRDLAVLGCDSLFGFADHHKGVAVASVFRLDEPHDPYRVQGRLANVIAHELGHLRGYRHCDNAGCLMSVVQSPAQIDLRPDRGCGRCPTVNPWTARIMGSLAACVFFAVFFAGLDLSAPLFGRAFNAPFT